MAYGRIDFNTSMRDRRLILAFRWRDGTQTAR